MEASMIERLKKDLAEAVSKKDIAKIEEIKNYLNISEEQAKYFDKGLTGYPSIDKVWLKYYKAGYDEKANVIPEDKTMWDVIEEKLKEYYNIPAIEYFGREFSRPKFIELCYIWARTFRAIGVEANEIVPVYGPFVPDIAAMLFGLNMIGACPYFLKLAISEKALEEETRDAKVAIVYDGMWKNVAKEFSKDKYKNVIVATVTANMPNPKKQIVSFLSAIQAKKNNSQIPNDKKYIWAEKARKLAEYYSGEVKVPFEKDRSAIITSSSGTTIGGVVKGTIATNESVLGQVISGALTETPYYVGDRVLNHFPPTASTSLNSLFLLGLYNGETIVMDPRVSENDFYNQLTKLKPNIALTTGSAWEAFFNRVLREMEQGKKFDFSYAKGWTIGGEGTDSKKFQKWNNIMIKANAFNQLFSGYGLSEAFSAVSVDNKNAERNYTTPMVGVGIPQVGMTMGSFDENGNELSYNQRGELRIKTKAMMKGYYNKSELTASTLEDGWIKTGDLASIDENGFLYVWGRMKDSIEVNNQKIYMFDIANKIKEKDFIDDVLVLSMPTDENEYNLVAHIVWKEKVSDENKKVYIKELNDMLKSYLPDWLKLETYADHDVMIPYSPTTLKKDKNRLSDQTDGFYQLDENGEIKCLEYYLLADGRRYMKLYRNEQTKRLIKTK